MEARSRPPPRPQPPAQRPNQLVQDGASQSNATMTNLKNFHDEAYLYIQQALSCDEHGQGEQAVVLYRKGLHCIEKGLEIPTERAGLDAAQLTKSKTMKEKMTRTRSQMQGRVNELLTDPTVSRALADPPPAYEASAARAATSTAGATAAPQATRSSSSHSDMDFEFLDLGDRIMADEENREEIPNAVEIFSIPDGVQVYFISSEGLVSAPSYPSSLGIYRLREVTPDGASNAQTPPAFLSVGNWTYPLLPGRSPALHANTGAYIFPDVNSPEEGAAVGVIIPDTVSAGEKARLEGLLKYLTDLRTVTQEEAEEVREEPGREVRPAEETRTSAQISKGIVTAAEWISWGLGKGAEKTGEWLKKGSDKLRENIQPDAQPRQVDARTQEGMKYARKATDTAVRVSAFIVDGLGKATLALGRQVAPHIRRQGEKFLPKSVTDSSGGQSKLDAVAEVAVGGLQGFGTVWLGLETAGKVLAKSLADQTVSVVKHKYGSQVGDTTQDALYTVGNAALTAHTARNLGIKAIAKRTAKDAGKAVVEDYRKARDIKTPSPQDDLLPPLEKQRKPPTPQ